MKDNNRRRDEKMVGEEMKVGRRRDEEIIGEEMK